MGLNRLNTSKGDKCSNKNDDGDKDNDDDIEFLKDLLMFNCI